MIVGALSSPRVIIFYVLCFDMLQIFQLFILSIILALFEETLLFMLKVQLQNCMSNALKTVFSL